VSRRGAVGGAAPRADPEGRIPLAGLVCAFVDDPSVRRGFADLAALRTDGTLARAEVAAGTITIKLRYGNFDTLTRQMSLDVPTDDAVRIYGTALVLLEQTWKRGRPVRLLGVGGGSSDAPDGAVAVVLSRAGGLLRMPSGCGRCICTGPGEMHALCATPRRGERGRAGLNKGARNQLPKE
jgi:hypothetical protein